MASNFCEDPAGRSVSSGMVAEESDSKDGVDRVDIPATHLSLTPSPKSSMPSESSTSSDSGAAESASAAITSSQSFFVRLKTLPDRMKGKIFGIFRKERITYMEYFNPTKEDRKALEILLSKLSPSEAEDFDPSIGLQVELHIPANNTCENGTQGFKGLADTGSMGYSLVKASVVERVDERYLPTERFSKKDQDRVSDLKGLGDSTLHILGSTVLQMFHPDAKYFTFHSKFYVVPDSDMPFDFILGTDFMFSVLANISFGKRKIKQKSTTLGAIDGFNRLRPGKTFLECVPGDAPQVDHCKKQSNQDLRKHDRETGLQSKL